MPLPAPAPIVVALEFEFEVFELLAGIGDDENEPGELPPVLLLSANCEHDFVAT